MTTMDERIRAPIEDDEAEKKRIEEKVERGEDLTLGELKLFIPARWTDGGQLEVQLSKRCNVVMRDLNGQETMRADAMLGSNTNTELKFKTYALMALTKCTINGETKALPAVDKAGVQVGARAMLFNAREAKMLADSYAFYFMAPVEEEDLKND